VPMILINGPEIVEEEEEDDDVDEEVFEPKLNMVYAFLRKVSPRSRSKPDPSKFESAVYPTIPPEHTVISLLSLVSNVWKTVLESKG